MYSLSIELKAISRVKQTNALIFELASFPQDFTLYGDIFDIFYKLSSDALLTKLEMESVVYLLSIKHLASNKYFEAGLSEIKND